MNAHVTGLLAAIAASAMFAATGAPALAGNIATNGGFETQGSGDATTAANWEEFGADPTSGSLAQRSSTNPETGAWAMHIEAFGSTTLGGHTPGIQQNTSVAGISLTPGSTVNLSFDANVAFNGVGDVAQYRLQILNTIGAIAVDGGWHNLATTGGAYQSFSTPDLTVPVLGSGANSAYYAFAQITANAGATAQGSNPDIWVDNVAINGTPTGAVPEPASLALLALGGMMLVYRRRKNAQA